MNPVLSPTSGTGTARSPEFPAPQYERRHAADGSAAGSADGEGAEHDACPLCQGRRLHYAFSTPARRVVRCADCRLVLLNPRPAAAEGVRQAAPTDGTAAEWAVGHLGGADPARESLAAATARHQLAQLARYRGQEGGAILVVDADTSALAAEASGRGYDVTRVRLRPHPSPLAKCVTGWTIAGPSLAAANLPAGQFDVCALTGALEAAPDPLALLRTARRLLKPDGVLLVVTSSLDALSARPSWQGSAEGGARLTWFDCNSIQSALHQVGFDQAIVQSPRHRRRLRGAGTAGGMLALARSAALPLRRTLSVVVPAYNEAATVGPLLDALLGKRLPGMRIEVIVVESNSTDGTRDVVRRYAAHPRVRLVLEDRPRGKGHAVRTGLAHATGDYVLIQDADLEYDLEDYDALLEPLVAGREALVLGSRHGGNAWWKMRRFAGQPVASFALNCGHWFFTTLLNVLFRQRLRDPFTMYKVFRRDCLFGLEFRCDRFDFDYELLVKLIRKGYNPVEIPVNYRSRSFKEGKKISAFRDPFNWLRALAWLRFVRVDPLAEVERQRTSARAKVRVEGPPEVPSRMAA